MLLPDDRPLILFHWPMTDPEICHIDPLRKVLQGLSRFGHSSSLVAARLEDALPVGEWQRLLPIPSDAAASPEHRLRVPWSGLLDSAELAYAAEERDKELEAALARRDAAAERGRPLMKFEASPRGRYDARHVTAGYLEDPGTTVTSTPWGRSLFVLQCIGGDRADLPSIWQITSALHKTLLDRWTRTYPEESVPAWISGHEPGEGNTAPSRDCHLAIIPLAHVDHVHADGRLLGIGLAFPRQMGSGSSESTLRADWRKMQAALFANRDLELTTADKAWALRLVPYDGSSNRAALSSHTWTRAAHLWHSVTPVILDRHPKPNFKKDPVLWAESCRSIVADSCERLGLPRPASDNIQVSLYPRLAGVPASPAFVAPVARPGRPPRFHIHVSVRFDEKIDGPLLLGAGRYRGYGLMRPDTTREK